jgi:hypothetical protein
MTELTPIRDLIERAIYDLEHGWPEASRDALGRALRLIPAAASELSS